MEAGQRTGDQLNPAGPDPLAILSALGVEADAVERVTGGLDTLLWRVEAGERYALRVFTASQVETAAKEETVMALARRAGVPAPEVVTSGSWNDLPALLLSWCPGRPVAEVLRREPWRGWQVGVLVGREQARLHRVEGVPDELPAATTGEPESWIGLAGDALVAEALAELPLRHDALIHLDYHPGNVIVDGDRVSGILDWANARLGDPRADLARTETLVRLATGGSPVTTFASRLFLRGWRHGYRETLADPEAMPLFHAWASALTVRDLAQHEGKHDGVGDLLERARRRARSCKEAAGLS